MIPRTGTPRSCTEVSQETHCSSITIIKAIQSLMISPTQNQIKDTDSNTGSSEGEKLTGNITDSLLDDSRTSNNHINDIDRGQKKVTDRIQDRRKERGNGTKESSQNKSPTIHFKLTRHITITARARATRTAQTAYNDQGKAEEQGECINDLIGPKSIEETREQSTS